MLLEKVSKSWEKSQLKLSKNKNTKKIFLNNGNSYRQSEKFKNIQLANTLEKISKKGAKEFYQGNTTIDIVKSLNELGGLHTLEDFEKQKTIKDNTIS